ncbi:MAG TPA: hypothetical protein VK914_02035 [bacterium]|nr:hypothetical protein [bacterium]
MDTDEFYLQGPNLKWLQNAPLGRGRFIKFVAMTETGVSACFTFSCNPVVHGSGNVKPGLLDENYPQSEIYTRIRQIIIDPRLCVGSLIFIGVRMELGAQTLTAWEVYDAAEFSSRTLLQEMAGPSVYGFEYVATIGKWWGRPGNENLALTNLEYPLHFKEDVALFLSNAKGSTIRSQGFDLEELAKKVILDMGEEFLEGLVGAVR